MKINLTQLTPQLSRSLAKFYWLSGDDAALQEEALALILEKATQNGFIDKKQFALSTQLEDHSLWQAIYNQDLWQQKKIILIHLNGSKLTQKGAAFFLECLKGLTEDILLIVQSAKLESAQYQTTWFKTADVDGVFIQLWPLTEKEWQKWLHDKIKCLGLTIDANGLSLLLHYFDGNLSAAKNALATLKLAFSQQTINETDIVALLTPQGEYTLNQLTDSILQGNAAKAERILQQLRQQGLEANLILWALVRELRLLTLLSDSPPATNEELAPYRLWPQRKAALQQASKRLANDQWKHCFKLAHHCDKIAKGIITDNIWLKLSQFTCAMVTGQFLEREYL